MRGLSAQGRSIMTAGALAATLAGGACGRRADEAAGGARVAGPGPVAAGYLAPPTVLSAATGRDGTVRVSGSAPPRAAVQLVSPEGEEVRLRADRRGGWSVRLPGGRPRLYALTSEAGGRTVHADGGLVTAPGALAAAVVVRAGDAALPFLPPGVRGLATVDYDDGGVTAAAGTAAPSAPLALVVDGRPAAAGKADATGRYALVVANRRLGLGPHRFEVRDPSGVSAARTVVLSPAAPLAAPYQAQPTEGGGWRIGWALTGGGEQTTVILPP